MFSPKKAGVSFLIGFIISLIAGIGGGVGFIVLFSRAILSGLFFAALVSGAMILYQKYLLNEEATSDTVQQKTTVDQPGSNVDITLDDDELPDSESAPNFELDMDLIQNSENSDEVLKPKLDNFFQASKLDTITASGEIPFTEKRGDDLPQKSSEDDISSKKTSVSNEGNKSIADTELDMLPDIESLVSRDDISSPSDDDDEIIQDTAFDEAEETKPTIPVNRLDVSDAQNIASAIRTILAKNA